MMRIVTVTDKDYEQALSDISSLKWRLAKYEAIMQPLEDELDELKFKVMAHMKTSLSDRTKPVDGYFLTFTAKPRLVISNPMELEDWLKANGYKAKDYSITGIDPSKVKAIAETAKAKDGEIIPGIEFATTEFVSVLKEKKK